MNHSSKNQNQVLMKWVVMIALSLAWLPMQAEDAHGDRGASGRFVQFNVHTGVGISTLVQNYMSTLPGISDFLLSPGCLVRNGVDVRFALSPVFGLATGMDFGINNSHYAMSLVDVSTGTISSLYVGHHFYDLTVPVYLSCHIPMGQRMAWNVDFGAYFAEGVGGTTKISGYTSGENSLGQPVVSNASYRTDYFDAEHPLIHGVRKFDWGPRVATGLVYKHRYTLNAVFQVSARNLAENQGVLDVRYRNLSLLFQIGYYF